MSKDRTPAEIAAIRKRRDRTRVVRGMAVWLVWWVIFIAGFMTGNEALMWVAFVLSMANNVYLYQENILRAVTGRPRADYRKIRKMEKRELPAKKRDA